MESGPTGGGPADPVHVTDRTTYARVAGETEGPDDRSCRNRRARPSGRASLPGAGPPESPDLSHLATKLRGPLGVVAVATAGLFGIALLALLKFGKPVALPILLAVLLNFVLSPPVKFLGNQLRLPTALAAALVLLSLLGAVGYGMYRLTGPASQWIERAPETIQEAAWKLRGVRRPVEDLERAAREVEYLVRMSDEDGTRREVQVDNGDDGILVLGLTRDLLASAAMMVFLLFFLLAAGNRFLRTLAHVLPPFGHRRKAAAIARRTEREVSRYLFTPSPFRSSTSS